MTHWLIEAGKIAGLLLLTGVAILLDGSIRRWIGRGRGW